MDAVVGVTRFVRVHRSRDRHPLGASQRRPLVDAACRDTGVILITAECLRSLEDIRRVLRALTWAGAFCGIVATLQSRLSLDVTPYLRWVLPGFSLNQIASANAEIVLRGRINRVFGTAIDPIELGVSAGMLLPLAVYLAMYDTKRSALRAMVSRHLHRDRRHGLCLPLSGLGHPRVDGRVRRLDAPGAAGEGTGGDAAGGGSHLRDLARIDRHAQDILPGRDERPVRRPPGEQLSVGRADGGQGAVVRPGRWHVHRQECGLHLRQPVPDDGDRARPGGCGGVGASSSLWPAIAALVARKRTADPELRDLAAALAGAALAAVVCSATFDSLSFPMFVNVQALVLGLIGAVWLVVDGERKAAQDVAGLSFGRSVKSTVSRPKRAGIGVVEPAGGN